MSQSRGTVDFEFRHEDADWSENDKEYFLLGASKEGVSIDISKLSDRTLLFEIDGALGHSFRVKVHDPPVAGRTVQVRLAWDEPGLVILINGQLVHSERVNP